nr:NADH dehydrogenase [ubiquinone] 1 alpha subcomplex subunit 4-like 2 isoform X1 [Odocoileus virginianus texanus]
MCFDVSTCLCILYACVCPECGHLRAPLPAGPCDVRARKSLCFLHSILFLSITVSQRQKWSPGMDTRGSDPLEWRVDEQKSPSSPTILFLADPGTAIRREMGVGVSLLKLPGLGQAGLG